MPWKVSDVERYNKGLGRRDKRVWVTVANNALKSCTAKGGKEAECAASAIRIANGVIKKRKEKAMEKSQIAENTTTGASAAPAPLVPENKVEENYYSDYVPSSVYSFEQLDALEKAADASEEIQELTTQFMSLVRNIVWWMEGDKLAAVKSVTGEFTARLEDILVNPQAGSNGNSNHSSDEDEMETATEDEPLPIFREANTVHVLELSDGNGVDMRTVPLEMKVRIIQPGWGNKVDNHYYPAEVLRRDAVKFTGVKMFESDHRDNEKSTRTWVSTIAEVSSFEDAGAPIGKVIVHDPSFAERVRALNTAGLLNKLECSIYASGRAQAGYKEGERLGKRITEITEAFSVDWVTRAGAGGQALELQENSLGGDCMKEEKKEENQIETAVTETASSEQPVAIIEGSQEETETAEQTETQEQPAAEAEVVPVVLSAEAVQALLVESRLPAVAVSKLATAQYVDEDAVRHAITAEREYLDAVIGAGEPVGMGETVPAVVVGDAVKVSEAANRVNKKYFGGR